jgi:hypothetical protein
MGEGFRTVATLEFLRRVAYVSKALVPCMMIMMMMIIIIIIIVIIIKIGRCLTLCCFVAHVLVVVSFVMSLLKKHWLVYRGGSNKAERAASAYYRYNGCVPCCCRHLTYWHWSMNRIFTVVFVM